MVETSLTVLIIVEGQKPASVELSALIETLLCAATVRRRIKSAIISFQLSLEKKPELLVVTGH